MQNLLRLLRLVTIIGLFVSVGFTATRALADDPPTSAYRRQIVHDGGLSYYVVGPRAPHLFMISRDLYGDEHRWKDIAQWNDLKAPYAVKSGQRLLIKTESTLTNSQANHQLIVAYTRLKRMESVAHIRLLEKQDDAVTESVAVTAVATPSPTPTIEPEPVAVVKATASPSPTPAAVVAPVAAPVATPAATPAPTPEAAVEAKSEVIEAAPLQDEKAEKKSESKAQDKKWSLAITPVISVARFHSEFVSTGINNTLNTKLDYGAEAEIGYKITDRSRLTFAVGVEKMDIKPSDDGTEIVGDSQTLTHASIGWSHEIGDSSAVRVGFTEDEEAFVAPSASSADVITIYVPQVSVGSVLGLIHHSDFGLGLSIDGLALLPVKKDPFDLNLGYGVTVGLNFENEFKGGKLVYGISARYLNQNGSDIKTWQKMSLARLGWEF